MEGFKELMQQAHGGDKGARDTLIAGNLGLVHTIANPVSYTHLTLPTT